MRNILISVVIFSLIGCSENPESKIQYNSKLKAKNTLQYSIYLEVIDGCEYLVLDGSYAGAIIHKQNCKNHK